MLTRELYLEIQTTRIHLRSFVKHDNQVLGLIESDFAQMKAPHSRKRPKIKIYIVEKTPQSKNQRPLPIRLFKTAMCSVYGWGSLRICDYGTALAESKWIGDTRCFWISGGDVDLQREIIYSIILSSLGEELDTQGVHRAHALAFEAQGQRCLLVGDSGAGKSTLACVLGEVAPQSRLFSDESPLLIGWHLHPFPLRIALFPEVAHKLGLSNGLPFKRKIHRIKHLFAFPSQSIAASGPTDFIFIARPHQMRPQIRRAQTQSAAWALFRSVVIGIGLAQMAEWMLRLPSLPKLIKIAVSRAQTAIHLLVHVRGVYEFDLSEDARLNAEVLLRFLTAKETLSTPITNSLKEA